jgi:hypothetical protein
MCSVAVFGQTTVVQELTQLFRVCMLNDMLVNSMQALVAAFVLWEQLRRLGSQS